MDLEVFNLDELRQEKQESANNALCSLYEKYFSYLDRSVHLRDKVRAKHIFQTKVGIPFEKLSETNWKLQFEHWFAFDYVTIFGSRMFDHYIREHREQLSTSMLQQSSFLLLMVLEPIIVKKVINPKEIVGTNLFEPKDEVIQNFYFQFQGIEEGDLLLLRNTRSAFNQVAIGPHMKVKDSLVQQIIEKITADFEETQKIGTFSSWRSFLKESGVSYLKYGESIE